jgi:hypothetical protein
MIRMSQISSQAKVVRYFHFTFVILDLSFVIEEAAYLQ